MFHRKIVNIILICLCCIPAFALDADTSAVTGKARDWYPRYVTFLSKEKLDSVLEYADTDIVPVVFNTSRWNTPHKEQADSICTLIDKLIADQRVEMQFVWVAGSSSPDGPVTWNETLGGRRAKVLADYLLSHSSLTAEQLRTENIGEDWRTLVRTLEQSDFPNKEKIIEIINSETSSYARKKKLRALDNGATWDKLVSELFPKLRNARMVIVCLDDAIAVYNPSPEVSSTDEVVWDKPSVYISDETFSPKVEEPTPVVEQKSVDTRFFAVKNNLLFDLALCANLGIEVELWRHWSFDLPVWYSPYNITSKRKIRLLATQPEIRWWTKRAGEGHFVGVNAAVVGFNIAVNDNARYQDPDHALWSVGASYGFATHLDKAKHWGLEFNLGVGYADYKYNSFYNKPNGQLFKQSSEKYFGITRIGISLSYKWYRERKNRRFMKW